MSRTSVGRPGFHLKIEVSFAKLQPAAGTLTPAGVSIKTTLINETRTDLGKKIDPAKIIK